MKKQSRFEILSGLAMVGQLGITLIFPILLCTLLGVWIQEKYQTGVWVIIVSVLAGVLTAGCSFYHFARGILLRARREDKTSDTPHDTEQEDSNR